MVKKSSLSMRSDGKLIVDVNALLSSERVRKDLSVLRRKITEADDRRDKDRHPIDSSPNR
ncbi:MAG: hypothetical protein M3N93_13755 [Acidobacteriota bacterium]|nr:hypothetical protein [Acidobacteriota bacterium]